MKNANLGIYKDVTMGLFVDWKEKLLSRFTGQPSKTRLGQLVPSLSRKALRS